MLGMLSFAVLSHPNNLKMPFQLEIKGLKARLNLGDPKAKGL
jgi:hypothetical protein